ncbi:hypothetical protein Nepgr_014458 [Nepenthes gracilis]|uniref:Pentatricopeptide repeat-containing protein n=1 Tax=Nepenthes gracilis TaxID=150966 RepID=A0AAD3SL52_NEPGR|nr:hypothetical protein Nepgr_014458 [Nepenthes gracilis]
MDRGCMLHALILKNGLFYGDPYAGTALLGLFGRHGFVDEAIRIFEALPKKSLITWNSIISLLVCHGFMVESLALFRELMSSNYSFSGTTLVSLLAGFTGEEDLELGGQLHGLAIKNCFDIEFSVSNTLLNMYVKCLDDGLSEKLFEEMPFRDVVSCNIMIGRIAKGERPERALMLLLNMSIDRVFPNQTTYVRVINSCATLRIPTYGEYVHAKVIKTHSSMMFLWVVPWLISMANAAYWMLLVAVLMKYMTKMLFHGML